MKVETKRVLGAGLGQRAPEPHRARSRRGLLRRWLRRSVRLQLTAWYGGALIVLLLVLGGLVYSLLAANLRRDAENQLKARTMQIAATLNVDESGMNFQDPPTQGEAILVYSANGVLLESAGGGQGSQGYRPSALPAWANQESGQSVFTTVTLADGRWLMYALPLSQAEQSTGSGEAGATQDAPGGGWLIVGRSLEPINRMLKQTLYALVLAGPLMILLACLGGYFMAGRALAPVAAITRTARRIQVEGLGHGPVSRIGMDGRQDELGELASTFDAMLARLEESFRRERRFTADAAHELRSPLAVVQAEASLALARSRRVGEYQRVLSVVESETACMGKLVTDLLTLARADAGQHHLMHTPVDLSALCRTVVSQLAALAADHGVALTADIQENITVMGDAAWLTQLLRNLIDNGLRYTPSGGWVQLRLEQCRTTVDVCVEDNGIGISAHQLPHIFDRFYRADPSRARDSEATGLGLGLAICAWIAQAHRGSIEVSSNVGQGSCFVVHLPQQGDGQASAKRHESTNTPEVPYDRQL